MREYCTQLDILNIYRTPEPFVYFSSNKSKKYLLNPSGIGGSAVYSKFDKIYVAKVIEDRFRNKENITFKAGTEETLELTDFNITKEQISLF